MIAKLTEKDWSGRLDRVKNYILHSFPPVDDFCVSLGGFKTVRIRSWFPDARELVRNQLLWIVTEPTDSPDATIWFWKESSPLDFCQRVLQISGTQDDRWDVFYYHRSASDSFPCGAIDRSGEWGIHLALGNEYFYGLADELKPGSRFSHWHHVFFEAFFRIMNGPQMSVVHGAAVGVSGKGVLLCARGGMGKSTLTVLSLLRGFDYVADDNMVLSVTGSGLEASPIYSYVSLSPEMYETMFDDLGRTRFMGIGCWKGKYMVDVSAFSDQVAWHLPIRAAVFPEIDRSASAPAVVPCTPQEKGRTIVQIAHSTISQMYREGFKQDQRDSDFIRKTVSMLSGLDFYRIILVPDLYANVECLRTFLGGLNTL